ncbi:NAD-dependent epimerase/dehydratase [Xylariaceae sp. FL0016]|nr:NAD-dependent epimerase/dehydratase [Xylariaceae sp. FL0016]
MVASQSHEEHVLITGGAGFIGQLLTSALIESSANLTLTITDVVEPPVPSSVSRHARRINAIQSDLTDAPAISSLLAPARPYTAVYLLHGLMSGGAEANLELGWRVNWDSHRAILDHLRARAPGTVVVFPSSLAVYGPPSSSSPPSGAATVTVTSEATCPAPRSSYGAQKLVAETYLGDLSRRGLLDGRVVRLPTVIVRPGAPSAAASSFASGVVREPLKGERSVLPVSRDLEMWVCSPKTVVRNLVFVKDVPREKLGMSIVVNLPGITVTVDQILKALGVVGGQKALDLIEEKRDPKIEAIVGSWPARFDIKRAQDMGMAGDGSLVETVKDFADGLS